MAFSMFVPSAWFGCFCAILVSAHSLKVIFMVPMVACHAIGRAFFSLHPCWGFSAIPLLSRICAWFLVLWLEPFLCLLFLVSVVLLAAALVLCGIRRHVADSFPASLASTNLRTCSNAMSCSCFLTDQAGSQNRLVHDIVCHAISSLCIIHVCFAIYT